jgi:hypothetical protein
MDTIKLERELTFDERIRWGECPFCKAPHGTPCHAEMGFQMGVKPDGARMKDGEGVHLARLRTAPVKVRLVPVE